MQRYVLTLTPSRFAPATGFAKGSYAYVVADRPVRVLGELITPAPITVQADADGRILQASLIPNIEADEDEEFYYNVSVFDDHGSLMYCGQFVMPEQDSNIFDLLPVQQDPDSCEQITVRDNS